MISSDSCLEFPIDKDYKYIMISNNINNHNYEYISVINRCGQGLLPEDGLGGPCLRSTRDLVPSCRGTDN